MADPKSWNPWHGCRRYSEGCKFCYMFVLDKAQTMAERGFVTIAFDPSFTGESGGEPRQMENELEIKGMQK